MLSESHKVLCQSIVNLEELEKAKRTISVRELSQVSPRVRRKLVSLIGEKPTVDCLLNGEITKALWDTGAMVSMVGLNG